MVMNNDQKIGARLKQARINAGFETAREAAASLGIPYPTYAGHENGSRGVVRAAPQYARRYRVTLDWLLTGKGDLYQADSMGKWKTQIQEGAREAAMLGASAVEIAEWVIDAIGGAFSDIARQQAAEEMQKAQMAVARHGRTDAKAGNRTE